jgi:adenosine deaminase
VSAVTAQTSTAPRPVDLAAAPKVLLHDHLDGGLRPATLVELADGIGHELPSTDPDELAAWFVASAESGSLVRYLETFAHTVAVLQTEAALERVAAEAVLDLAADGVVHAEIRYAPELCTEGGLALEAVVEAVQAGFARGVREAAAAGHRIGIGTLIDAMRQADNHVAAARLAVRYRDAGVVGFDIAGPEAGFPASRQAEAFDLLRAEHVPFTVHAGEAAGMDSVEDALSVGALRLGHGVRVADDVVAADAPGGAPQLGRTAAWIRDRRIALEASPTSNVQTGAAPSIAGHPSTLLKDLGFAVTVNTDNRLVSGTSMTKEMSLLREQAGWSDTDLALASVAAAEAAFLPLPVREELVLRVRDGWAALAG